LNAFGLGFGPILAGLDRRCPEGGLENHFFSGKHVGESNQPNYIAGKIELSQDGGIPKSSKVSVKIVLWVKQCHKPSPSHHNFYRWYKLTLPSHGWFMAFS